MLRTIIDLLLASVMVGVVLSQLAPQGDLNTLGTAANSQPWPGFPPQGYPNPSMGGYPFGAPPPAAAMPPFMPPPGGNNGMGMFSNPFLMAYWMNSIF